jgi:hypothetical protein
MRYATAYLFNAITGRTHAAYFREMAHDRGHGLTRWRSQGHHATGTEDGRELWAHLITMRRTVYELQDGRDQWLGSFSWDGDLPVVLEVFDKPITVDAGDCSACGDGMHAADVHQRGDVRVHRACFASLGMAEVDALAREAY